MSARAGENRMADDAMLPADDMADRSVWPRAPMAAVTASVIAGILLDRFGSVGWIAWSAAVVVLLMGAIITTRRAERFATLLLLGCCVAVGGMRHHLSWSVIAADDISRLTEAEPRLVRMIGIIDSPVMVLAADDSRMTPPWMQVDRSMCDLNCEAILVDGERTPVSGCTRLTVTGHLLHVELGDRVDVVGKLRVPGGPTNPGAYDYRQHLLRQGVRCAVDCNHPDGVRLLEAGVASRIGRWRVRLREDCETIFVQHLDRKNVPLALSLLVGDRSQLPWDVRTAFAESGTMHLLAISGLHVGILAGLLVLVCRLFNLSVTTTTLVVLVGIGSYAFVTNLRPPVVRASVLAVVAAAGWPAYRRIGAVNLIAVCGLVVLLINPTDLFDTGTQLSFLAVVAIGWAATVIGRLRRRDRGDSLLPNLFVRRPGVGWTLVRWLLEGYLVTTAIWAFTLPLTAARYHIAAPVGYLVNVLLLPYVAVLLALGFLTIACGLLLPWVVKGPALLFDLSLDGLQRCVETASTLHLGHVYLSGPPMWWLVCFYSLLAATLLLKRWRFLGRWAWAGVWAWIVIGQLAAFHQPSRKSLRCTFLDVGHGCCVVLELPDGETLLYDAGKFASDRRGQRVIQSALWERGIRQIDGVIASHADVDHFNVASLLMQTMPVGTLMINRTFLDFMQPPVALLCDAASRCRVPIALVEAGDRLDVGHSVSLDVLHPANAWQSDLDNANSIVLRVTYAGRTILLTGDLEEDGLTRLLDSPPVGVDVLLAPHHGSRRANPTALGDWARPETVIVSGGDVDTESTLRGRYRDADAILSTHSAGAVTVEIKADAELSVTPFVKTSVP